eukprot:1161922-Pelagomonas_calceolata.AAC.8
MEVCVSLNLASSRFQENQPRAIGNKILKGRALYQGMSVVNALITSYCRHTSQPTMTVFPICSKAANLPYLLNFHGRASEPTMAVPLIAAVRQQNLSCSTAARQ